MKNDAEIMQGLSLLTVIKVKNSHETLVRAGKMDPASGKARGFLVLDYGRILVSTDASFETEESAKAHMEEVVQACLRADLETLV